MNGMKSLDSLLSFLDYLNSKGLMNQETATARKTAVSRVLSVLEEAEKLDVTSVDLDHAMMRFQNLQGKGYTPGSLRTYQGRVRAAIDEFKRYLENPLAFKSSVQPRDRKPIQGKAPQAGVGQPVYEQPAKETPPPSSGPLGNSIIPIPIRADLTVFIQGLPFDLTEIEARKIASVVQAMATPI